MRHSMPSVLSNDKVDKVGGRSLHEDRFASLIRVNPAEPLDRRPVVRTKTRKKRNR